MTIRLKGVFGQSRTWINWSLAYSWTRVRTGSSWDASRYLSDRSLKRGASGTRVNHRRRGDDQASHPILCKGIEGNNQVTERTRRSWKPTLVNVDLRFWKRRLDNINLRHPPAAEQGRDEREIRTLHYHYGPKHVSLDLLHTTVTRERSRFTPLSMLFVHRPQLIWIQDEDECKGYRMSLWYV